jgi:uncharacterized protein (TIGR02598 family)
MRDSQRDGFSLVEVTLALGIAAFCLVAIFGLLPVGLNTSQSASQQTGANGILSAVISDLRATPPTQPPGLAVSSQEYSIPIPANPVSSPPDPVTVFFSEAGGKVLTAPEARYRLTVQFLPNGSSAAAATFVNLKVSWPASIDPGSARPPASVQMFTALDRNQ